MSTNASDTPPPAEDPRDPESIARIVLGPTDDPHRAEALQRIVANPQSRRIAATLAEIRDVVVASAAEAADPPPESLFERASALADRLPRVPPWLDRLRALVLAPIEDALGRGLAGVVQPALRGARMELRSFELDGCRLDVSVEPDGMGLTTLRLQIEMSADDLSGECVALDAASGSVVGEAALDRDGAAAVKIDLRGVAIERVDLALRLAGRVHLAEGIALR